MPPARVCSAAHTRRGGEFDGDPAIANIISSLSRTGANLTGVTAFSEELAGKRMRLLKETVPQFTRVAAIPDNPINRHVRTIAEFAEAGNLLSYGPNQDAYFRHVAVYVDKLLKGAHAAELPVEQPTVFEMVVNLAAAKSIGLAVPRTVMLRADRTVG